MKMEESDRYYIEKLYNNLKNVRYWLWSIDNISLSM